VDVRVAEGVNVGAGVLVDRVGTGVAVRGGVDTWHPSSIIDRKMHIKKDWLFFIKYLS
jgi:hypothetical protein